MDEDNQLVQERLRKLKELVSLDVNPFPYSFDKKDNAAEINDKYSKLKKEETTSDKVSVAGRIMRLRRMGKVTFMDLQDQTARVQLYFKQDDLGKDKYKILKKLDIGDIVGIDGTVFKTKTGEVTIYVKDYEVLTKTLIPLPEKFHGLKDDEIRYRQRYLDLMMNPDVREIFIKRTIIIDAIREFLKEKGFLEVETPTLQPIYGGANAKPFETHINAWDMKMYLSISPELYLKRLLVGGFEKVFTIAKNFRNEGVDRSHNPEFTMMECYQAYADYEDMMGLMEEMIEYACKKANGTTKVKYDGKTLDFKAPWKRITMKQALKKYAEIDVDKLSDEELFDLRTTYNLEMEGDVTRGSVIQALFEGLCEDKLTGPVHVIDHPIESTPLCKPKRGNPDLIERFETFLMGKEISNAYSELNDPILQRELLEKQAKELRAGSEEAHPMDEDFVNSIEFGMPPAGGLGVGIDRIAVFLTGAKSIREVIFFPIMKPKEDEESGKEKKQKSIKDRKSTKDDKSAGHKKGRKKKENKVKDKNNDRKKKGKKSGK